MTRRRFTILDALALVAAAAAGFGLVRFTADAPSRQPRPSPTSALAVARAVAFALSVTVAFLGLAGRTSRRALRRAPGVVACLAVTLAGALQPLLWWSLLPQLGPTPTTLAMILDLTVTDARDLCLAVLVAWLAPALAVRWRCDFDWVNLAGCLLGGFWIAAGMAVPVIAYLRGY